MQTLDKATYILGIVAMAMQSLSVVLAAFFALRSLCGRVGRGFICFGVIYRCRRTLPFSIVYGSLGRSFFESVTLL